MTTRTLLLTLAYTPHKIISLDRAMSMLFSGKVEIVEEYDEVIGRLNESRLRDFPNLAKAYKRRTGDGLGELIIRIPSVAVLNKHVGGMKRGVKFSRINVFTRDGYKCQYCGDKKSASELNYDHVTPRRQGGRTVWENIVAACYKCNGHKADRTPEQAGMKLRKHPVKPKSLPMVSPKFSATGIPEEWTPYVESWIED